MVRTRHFHCQGPGFNLWPGNEDSSNHNNKYSTFCRKKTHLSGSPCLLYIYPCVSFYFSLSSTPLSNSASLCVSMRVVRVSVCLSVSALPSSISVTSSISLTHSAHLRVLSASPSLCGSPPPPSLSSESPLHLRLSCSLSLCVCLCVLPSLPLFL